MSVLMVRSKVKPQYADAIEAAVTKLFAAIVEAQPAGIRYASGKLQDGETYVALLEVAEGLQNPIAGLQAFQDFQAGLREWVAEPPVIEQLTLLGSYQLFDSAP
ncbi:MAG: hypothetical protein V7637_3164 [Mycobacteriales bacterium]|jgi:quinol monooxygenase YgiN